MDVPSSPPVPPVLPVLPVASLSYATPYQYDQTHVWRDGPLLVLRHNAPLPGRCVKCNGPAAHHLTRKLTWHHPNLYLLILPGLLVYAVVALCVQKKATVIVPLCDQHHRSRRTKLIVAWALALAGAIGVIAGCMGLGMARSGQETMPGMFLVASFVLLIAGGIVGVAVSNPLKAAKIDDQFVTLKGAAPQYLAEVPPVR